MQEKKLTGYPSIDKPWLKYYSEEAINAPLPECTIYEYLWENNKDHLDDIALNYFDRKITYGELFEHIEKAARGFYSIGVREGDIVTVFSINTPETIYCLYALNLLGAVPNMEYVTETAKEAVAAIEKCESKTVIVLDVLLPKFASVADCKIVKSIIVLSVSESMPAVKKIIFKIRQKKQSCKKAIPFDSMIKCGMEYVRTIYKKDKPAVIVHSGGTTGDPKGVLLSNYNLNSVAWQNINYGINYIRKEKFLHSIPPFHAFGLTLGIHMPLCLGLTMILTVKLDENGIFAAFCRYKPNYVIVGPTHALEIANKSKTDLSFVKMFCMGGASITEEQEKRINRFLKEHNSKSNACVGYGLSETSSEICAEINRWYGKVGSVGIPFCKANVKILNSDTGKEQKYNQTGEICFSGPGIMLGYYKSEKETKEALFVDNSGETYLHTGDLGYMDSEGFVFITGRIKRIYATRVTPGGTFYKLFPDYVEKTIKNLKEVDNCAVVCINDPIYKHIAVAFVMVRNEYDSVTELSIQMQIKDLIPEHSMPKKILFVDSLPITPIGKINYRALETLAEEMSKE